MEFVEQLYYVHDMSQTLEMRVERLEKKVAELTADAKRNKDWRKTVGIFKNDRDFEQAAQLGREYRQQQTHEKEIAGS